MNTTNKKAARAATREAAFIKTSQQQSNSYPAVATPNPHNGAPSIELETLEHMEARSGISTERRTRHFRLLRVDICASCRSPNIFAGGKFQRSPYRPEDGAWLFLCEQCYVQAAPDGEVTQQFVRMLDAKADHALVHGLFFDPSVRNA